ncbi:MAG: leucine-rich repeat domain-containing protein, partial [Clostridia bacterium]|nr:leucine-rich repeat domain-containing protein [Clostridia bacterium]
FIFESEVDGAEAVEIPLSNIYDVDYRSESRKNVYTARMIRISEEIAVIGIMLNSGSYLYCYSGLFHVSTEIENEYGFMMNVSIFPTQGYEAIEEEYGWFLFRIENGRFYQYDDAFEYECSLGKLKTDGYGSAEFTPAGGRVIRGTYVYEGNLVIMDTLTAKYIFRVLDISTGSFELISAVSSIAGFYYTISSDGGVGTDSVFLDGKDVALLYRGSSIIWGTYERTGNSEREEYKLTFVVNGDEGEKNTLTYYIVVARTQDYGNLYILRDDTQLGEFEVEDNGEVVGTLSGDGYLSARYTLSDGTVYEGVMQRGDIVDNAYDSPRQFEPSVEGKNVLFAVSDENGSAVRQFIFNIVNGKAILRTMSYGAYGLRDNGEFTNAYIYLDGVGVAVLYDESGEEIERGEYKRFTEKGEGAYQYVGEHSFVFTAYTLQSRYAYSVYSAKSDGVYIGEGWSVLILDGFGEAKYIDSFGFAISGEAVLVLDDLVVFTPDDYSYDVTYFRISEAGFEIITDSWILAGDMLYQYIGRIGRTMKIPDGIKSIADGAFDLVKSDMDYLEVLDLNEVQEIGKRVFANSGLVTVTALNLRVIGEGAFYGCSELTSVVLKDVTSIGANAFSRDANSYSTIRINISAVEDFSVVTISDSAFTAIGGENNINVIFTVNDLESFNAVYGSNISAGVKANVFIASSGRDTLSGATYFGFKTGNVYSFSGGRVLKDINTNGSYYVAATVEYARYYINGDGVAVLYLYSASEGKWVNGESVGRDDSVLALNSDIWVKHFTYVTLADTDSETEISFNLEVYRTENENETDKWDIDVSFGWTSDSIEYDYDTNEVVAIIGTNSEVRISVSSVEQFV